MRRPRRLAAYQESAHLSHTLGVLLGSLDWTLQAMLSRDIPWSVFQINLRHTIIVKRQDLSSLFPRRPKFHISHLVTVTRVHVAHTGL